MYILYTPTHIFIYTHPKQIYELEAEWFFLVYMLQHIAASKGCVECVDLLIDNGADPNSIGIDSHS